MKRKLLSSLLLTTSIMLVAACSNETGAVVYEDSKEAQSTPIIEGNGEQATLVTVDSESETAVGSAASVNQDSSEAGAETAETEDSSLISEEITLVNESALDETQDAITQSQAVDTTAAAAVPAALEEIVVANGTAGSSSALSEIDSSSSIVSESSAGQATIANADSSSTSTGDESTAPATYNNQLALKLLQEAAPLIHLGSGNVFKSNEYYFVPVALSETIAQIEVRRQSPDNQEHDNLITIYRYDAEHGHLIELDMQSNEWVKVES